MRFYSVLAIAAALPAALAEIAITDPNGLSTCSGGKPCNVNWKEGGNAPLLGQSGVCDFSIYTGSQQQQTFLSQITPSVNVVATAALVFVVDPTIGPNSNAYFIRAQCSVADPANPALPLLAFSHRFTLDTMSGPAFNASVQSQLAGIPATDLPGNTLVGGSAAGPTSSPSGSTPAKTATTTGAKSTSTSTKADSSAGSHGVSAGLVLVAGSLAALLI